ncbi:CRTAC1 family protein [Dyadobacter luticola]|uniref:CRTAC1 family protein n=1 Tax=Dyadobacter luticola TaxID=1979387 RepID=UPI001486EFDC|nr:CRTAC1 family protein [Dyadobacter luticola]
MTLAFVGASAQKNSLPLRITGYKHIQKNQPKEAEMAFLKAIKVEPKDPASYADLGELYLSQKNFVKAENIAKTGLKVKPASIELRTILAAAYAGKNDKQNAILQLNDIVKRSPKSAFAYYKLANINKAEKKKYLFATLRYDPASVVVRLDLAQLFIQEKKSDSATFYLQGIKKVSPALSPVLNSQYAKIISELKKNQFAKALPSLEHFRDLFKITNTYIKSLSVLQEPKLPIGYAEFTSSEFMNTPMPTGRQEGLQGFRFTDAADLFGTEPKKVGEISNPILAVTDYSEGGEMYVYTSSVTGGNQRCRLLVSGIGSFREIANPLMHNEKDQDAAFCDYDNDGYQDLFIATSKGILVIKNKGDGFIFQKDNIGLGKAVNVRKMLFADLDQDGDLDLYAATGTSNLFFRNNNNGTFTEQASAMGLTAAGGTYDLKFADYDVDGDLDILASSGSTGLKLFNNNRHSRFTDASSSAGLENVKGEVSAFGDYNNDGLTDVFVAGAGKSQLLKNTKGRTFNADAATEVIDNALQNLKVRDAVFFDFDNDGYLDLLVAEVLANVSTKSLYLFHNENGKKFTNVTNLLPQNIAEAYRIGIADFNEDGDDDIFLDTSDGPKMLRNDSGNSNNFMIVKLSGLGYGNNKNNRLGIGAQLELKAGDLYQLKTVTRAVTTFGVGKRKTLDAVRIIWPNGTPQIINDPSSNQRIVENEMLKGSCPFLFVWNGTNYEFLKDMMWRSALGMPFAVKGNDTTYAFSDPSKEYLLIPGEKIKPKDDKYTIKITEELWEAVYFDKAELIAIDHPDSVDVFADERFVAPPFPGKKVYPLAAKNLPVSAVDEEGNDVLPKIKSYDFNYVSNLEPGSFQGVVHDHDIVLDLGDKALKDSLFLFLRGWIFPSDASINLSMTQSDDIKSSPPSLQVINQKGEWETVIPFMGFPMGKDKMMILDLTGKFLTTDNRKVRIKTNMQIYWDEIFFANSISKAPVSMTTLNMTSANLAFRGYSQSFTKGGPFGPHWFKYENPSKGQKWRDLTGNYTRYGDVLPLLQYADDEYIIANSGDEITIDFDAKKLPILQKGWKRNFLIYSEGWVKDGDLNTANGQTVAPLPFHAMPSYPYSKNVAYPADEKHEQYQRQYNTRTVDTELFKNTLKP